MSAQVSSSAPQAHRVAVIGAGFGGLFAVRALKNAPVSITMIDRTNHHLFQPLLYQVATGILSEGDIAPPIRDVLRHYRNTEVLIGNVTEVDLAHRKLKVVQLGETLEVKYDSLIVAAGAGQSYFGHPEFSRYAPGMKSIDNALEIRGRIFGAFEMAERETDPEKRRQYLTFVIVGGGPTGVEMAGQIAELSRRSLKDNFRHIDPASARVVLIDAGDALIPAFGKRLSGKALAGLRGLGVEVLLNTPVTNVDANGVDAKPTAGGDLRINAQTKIWAAGVEASSLGGLLGKQSGAEVDKSGRVKVNPDLTLPGHPEVFLIGDMINLDKLPGVAEVAMQGGIHAARTIKRRVEQADPNLPAKPFHYRNLGDLATISRFKAVANIGPFRVAGFVGWLLWLFVHLTFLTGFKNRIATVFNWFIAFIGHGRPQRTITQQQVDAREALQREEREKRQTQ
ncbi:MAG TPA: NAD(P)/FAD-dependent oxidoreductase [Frankiaceae bacterium]|jgi:NADH dehydrogenase|nr:NAD(P)/FAD-dependent oxidoreductase [Frankiaceae bacterium]